MSTTNSEVVDALRAALKERDRLRTENARLLGGAGEPIAIVGMACRYPGGVASPEQLWDLVAEGRDAIGDFPADRGWDLDRLFDPDPDNAGTSYVSEGGFLDDASGFDSAFFGVLPHDALLMDPQQRLLLEVAWEALEGAGIDPSGLRGSQAGVFAGVMYGDYGWGREPTSLEPDGSSPPAGAASVLAGGVSYALGLEGPAITVDTACSSSLVAMHLAAQALRAGECEMALAGGSTVLATPRAFVDFSRQRALAADGRCKAFAESADGVGFAEGVGVLALRRLSDAEREGEPVLATIRGSAVNQDGASNGITAPNGPSQERAIRQALASAGLQPTDVDAVEAHGTGTPLGDPIEAQVLLATYGQERERPLWLGSVKSNIGHTQAAAGVAGVIKTVMAMRAGLLPKTLHVDAPSQHVDWESGQVELLREPTEWAADERPRRAAVSSFGASGTNAHLILEQGSATDAEEHRDRRAPEGEAPLPGPLPLVLSAKDEEALRDSARRLADHLQRSDEEPADVAFSLTGSRPRFERRAVAVGGDRAALVAALSRFAGGEIDDAVVSGVAASERQPIFLFPGYGSQWPGMALELIETSPRFARRMRECTEAFEPHLEWNLEDILRGAEGVPTFEWPFVGTPALFATCVCLTDLWRACGVEPAAVAGHSQGEMAAAHVVGGLTLDEAAYAVMARLDLMRALEGGHGAMAAVGLAEAELASRLERHGGRVEIAALNGPASAVVSGDAEAVDELVYQCEAEGLQARKIRGATGASHSHHVEALREPLLESLARLRPRGSEVPFYSTVDGAIVDTAELDAEYWYRNLRQTVRLAPTVEALIGDGFRTLIEVGPHPVLSIGVQETAEATGRDPVAVLETLRRKDGGAQRFALSLGAAHAAGAPVDWDAFFAGSDAKAVRLPTYPFQRKTYWLSAGSSSNPTAVGQSATEHPLLAATIEDAGGEGLILTGRVSLGSHPWLGDHAAAGMPLLPGTAFVELALRAGEEADCGALEELTLQAPLMLPESGAVALQVRVGPAGEREERSVSIHSRADGAEEWTCHAEGVLTERGGSNPEDLGTWPPPGAEPLDLDGFYERLAAESFEYGPAFQGLTDAWRLGDDVYAEVSLAAEQRSEAARCGIHPALLDSALHGILAASLADGGLEPKLPFAWEGVTIFTKGATELRVRISPTPGGEAAQLSLADPLGAPVAQVAAVRAREVSLEALGGSRPREDGLFGIEWTEIAVDSDRATAEEEPVELVALDELEFDRSGDPVEVAHAAVGSALALIQERLRPEGSAASRLALLTEGAVGTAREEEPSLDGAAVWGLLRSAQSEHPGRFALIDSDGSPASREAIPAALVASAEEPQLALRAGKLLAPRIVPGTGGDSLVPPPGPWCLQAPGGGTLEDLALVPHPRAGDSLEPGEVRVAVEAGGVNFRDVMAVLGVYPGEAGIGGEGAGVVVEVGPEVEDLAVGDRVLGMIPGSFGPLAVADRSLLVPLPEGWSFEQGAALPIVYLTAWFGLRDLAELKPGERVLVHAGAGGVGSAAIQIARWLGAEVFATASPSKWGALREIGLEDDHIASSRDLEFKGRFHAATGGEGVDVVLNALAGEFVDASLELLRGGGRFLEMGKTDVRDAEAVAAEHPGVSYRAYDLGDAKLERLREILIEVVGLLDRGEIQHSPLRTWDVRRAPEAFRLLREGGNVGKIVLTVPRPLDPERTVLISGGTGGLGALLAHHLVDAHGARHLLLVSRSGREADGADELAAELEEIGGTVRIEACDVGDRGQLETLLSSVDPEHPLGAVIHAAAVLADGVIESMEPDQVERVFAPKLDAAWHLHELTKDSDLTAFVLFSSLAGTLGAPGQANYSAANAFLDGLAWRRRAQGLPASSIAWGLWTEAGGVAGKLDEVDMARMERSGIVPLSNERGLGLFDAALAGEAPLVLAAGFDRAALGAAVSAGLAPPIFSRLVRAPLRRRSASSVGLAARLAKLPESEREDTVIDLIREEAAAVLGEGAAAQIDPDLPFKDLGFDSLAAVELRNRIGTVTGLRLPPALAFDYPTTRALAAYVLREVMGGGEESRAVVRAQVSEEPIAIVGMSCRFPGGVSSPTELWQLVAEGGDAVTEFPTDRGWDLERLYDADPDRAGTMYVREGGFLHDAGEFDPLFFGISPREALAADPQQRLLLETSWEALEATGVDPSSLRGSPTGVFAGLSSQDYTVGLWSSAGEALEGYRMTGGASSVASGRIAYQFGFEGPAITIDTACSSSLVAMHLAAQALRAGECELALAGGATVLASPGLFIEFSRQRGGAPDGRCKPFAEAADGVGSSEGVGMLVLERLSEAEANGHKVLATIKGSAVNQDGASNGLTAPNGPSQERVIRQALANARLEAKDVDVVEAHGTGTTLGDPIEAGALLATYGQDREQPLLLGSIKSNIGHAQAAAGVAGVIKAVMAMKEGVLPKSLHIDSPSTKVEWGEGKVELLTEAKEWQPNGRPRRAGVSSFGISGTNAHLILEEAPVPGRDPGPGAFTKDEGERSLPGPIPLVLSAKTPEALKAQASRLVAHLKANPEQDPTDLAFSLATTRAQLEQRAAVVGVETEELLAGLASLAQGEPAPNTTTAQAREGRLAYLFTGQGSQRAGMGKELYATHPVYAEALDQACEEIDKHLDHSLKDLLFAKEGSKKAALLDDTTYAQPALFATELALYRLFESFGLKAELLTGHSVGEIVAAHISGVFDLKDAAKLISARGKLMGGLPPGGAMLAIEATEQEALEAIEGEEELLSLAAINSPNATVISGDAKAIEEQEELFKDKGKKTKRLTVSHAFHSPLIEPMLEPFGEVLSELTLNPSKLPVISNTTGGELTPEQATDPAYWVTHARSPVRFADSIATLKERGTTAYLELGPEAVLTAMAAQCLGDSTDAELIPTLRGGREETTAAALAFASAWSAGAKVEWDAYFKGSAPSVVPLPTYAFERKRYWISSSSAGSDPAAIGLSDADHPLLSAAIEDPRGEGLTFTGRISTQSHPWLSDHAVAGTAILPGTAFVEMALAAGRQVGCGTLEELTLHEPLSLPAAGAAQVQMWLGAANEEGKRPISVHARLEPHRDEAEAQDWILHAEGVLSVAQPTAAESHLAWPPKGAEPLDPSSLYDDLAAAGFEYGPAFQGLIRAWRLGEEVYAEVSLAEVQAGEAGRYVIHPALFDAALHGIPLASAGGGAEVGPRFPLAWHDVSVLRAGAERLRVKIAPGGEDEVSLEISDPDGVGVGRVGSVRTRTVSAEELGVDTGVQPRRVARRPAPIVSLLDRLADLPAAEHEAATLALVRSEVAAVLGHSSTDTVPVDQPFNELGFDSLAAVEMRNRLGLSSGLRLPETVVFDYPTATVLAEYLLAEINGREGAEAEAEMGRLEAALGEISAEDPRRQGLATHLRALAADLEGSAVKSNGDAAIDRLESATDEELLEFIDEQVGS